MRKTSIKFLILFTVFYTLSFRKRTNIKKVLFNNLMNKQIPSVNKIVEFHNFKRSMQLHQTKIKNARSTLTTRTPNPLKINLTLNKTAKHPYGNNFTRMIEIEIENKALLKKLTQKSNKSATSPHSHQQSWQQQSYMKQITNNRKKYFEQHERRIQNEGLLKRLKSVKPLYEMRKYMSERKTTEKYINSISKFNYKHYKPNKTIIKFDMDLVRKPNDLASSRKQKTKQDEQVEEKENNFYVRSWLNQDQDYGDSRIQNQKKQYKKLKKAHHSKIHIFAQRNPNIHQKTQSKPQDKPSLKFSKQNQQIDMKQSKTSFYKASENNFQLSQSQTKMMQSSFVVNQIPQKQIRINGKLFVLKGKQTMTKLRLEILEGKKDKTMGNEYIHEVEIPNALYKKKFGGRIDVIVENLKFSDKNSAFYIS